ncbi:COP9 signalosome complex subunit 2 [Smittium culicis]|uniref:COP9 signalosome complex subunit 2 n=1 Tax=Smittium culicis TaxID=133412 RepID=A0A1R1YKW8_9FUNG|nr:COP9 signalosome complex subunit 2 [Smittium culicis]
MSDDDSFMYDDDDYGFEYEDDEDDVQQDSIITIENMYYTAKAIKTTDPGSAVEQFKNVIQTELEQGEW